MFGWQSLFHHSYRTEIINFFCSRFPGTFWKKILADIWKDIFLLIILPDNLELRIRSGGQHTGCMSCQPHLVYKCIGQFGQHSFGCVSPQGYSCRTKIINFFSSRFQGTIGKTISSWHLPLGHIFQFITYLTSLSWEPIVLDSTLVACPANNILLTNALASLDITCLVDRASWVTVTGLKS